ncbi:MAG: flippase [Rikenellaceae bacterium]|nr:flippase [Rikenellaceae bacterium]
MAKTSIKKNFTYQMIYEILVIILPFITSPYISRVLGAENLGEYSYSYSVAYYFVLFSMLGIKNYGNREIARVRDDKKELNRTFSNIFFVHVFFSVICSICYIGYVSVISEGQLYAFIQAAYVISAIFDISWFYFGIEKFKLTVTRNTIVKIANVICIFVFVRASGDLWKYCVIMSVGTLLSQLSLWIPLRHYVKIQKPSVSEMKRHVGPLFVLFIPALAVSLYKYMDKIMIGSLSSKVQLGYYENAEKANNIPLTIISAFGTVMMPKMSNLAATGNKKESKRYMKISMEFVMCLAFALAFGIGGVADVFAPVFWGKNFTDCGWLITGLSVTIPFIAFANVIRTQYLIPEKRDKEYLTSVIIGAVVNLTLNSILIPILDAKGAVIGTIAAEVSVCLVQVFVVRNELPVMNYFVKSLPFLGFGVVMSIPLILIEGALGIHLYTLLLQIAVGGLLYLVLCCIYFTKTKNAVFLNTISQIRNKIHK